MPNVRLVFVNGSVVAPGRTQVNWSDRTITFQLIPGASSFAPIPITFSHPPAGYHPWHGTVGPVSGNTVTVTAPAIGAGLKEQYKYNISCANGFELDPVIENTGSGPRKPKE